MEFEKLQGIMAEDLNVDADEITPETTLVDDLGADSLDIFQIIMGIEEELILRSRTRRWRRLFPWAMRRKRSGMRLTDTGRLLQPPFFEREKRVRNDRF